MDLWEFVKRYRASVILVVVVWGVTVLVLVAIGPVIHF